MNVITTEQRRQHEDHRAVKERLMNPKPPMLLTQVTDQRGEYEAEIKRLRDRNRGLSTKNNQMTRDLATALKSLEEITLKLSDAQATILRQAETLCELDEIDFKTASRRPARVIATEVLKDFPGIEWDDVKGLSRQRIYTIPRHLCIAAIYEERDDLSMPAIGRLFGGRDHSTILHSIHKIKAIMEGMKPVSSPTHHPIREKAKV